MPVFKSIEKERVIPHSQDLSEGAEMGRALSIFRRDGEFEYSASIEPIGVAGTGNANLTIRSSGDARRLCVSMSARVAAGTVVSPIFTPAPLGYLCKSLAYTRPSTSIGSSSAGSCSSLYGHRALGCLWRVCKGAGHFGSSAAGGASTRRTASEFLLDPPFFRLGAHGIPSGIPVASALDAQVQRANRFRDSQRGRSAAVGVRHTRIRAFLGVCSASVVFQRALIASSA